MAEEGRSTFEPLVADKVKAAQTRPTAKGTIRGGIQGDLVVVVLEFQVRDSVPVDNIGPPPENVEVKVVIKGDNGALAEAPPECLQHPRKLKLTRSDNLTYLEELAEQGLELHMGSRGLTRP
jgi:hypothetical protein